MAKTCNVNEKNTPMTKGTIMTLLAGCVFGFVLMLTVHIALTGSAERIHAKQLVEARQAESTKLTTCQEKLKGYADIRRLEQDAIAAMAERR